MDFWASLKSCLVKVSVFDDMRNLESLVSLLVLSLLFFGCNHIESKKEQTEGNNTVVSEKRRRDSIKKQMALGNRPDEEQETPSYMEEMKNLLSSYDKIKVVDTTFEGGTKLSFKYYCLKDNGIHIPKQYIYDTRVKPFTTHNFTSQIVVCKAGDTLLNQTISKGTFTDQLSPQLQKYGCLLYPNISFDQEKKEINVGYSISIPVTDIGVPVRLVVDKNGKLLTFSL